MTDETTDSIAREDAVLDEAAGWLAEDVGCAIATVTETWGSSPRPVGSQLAVSGDGRFLGSVSGGCVEGAVVTLAKEAIAAKASRRAEFGVTDEDAWAVGLACGGRIVVTVEPAGGDAFSAPTLDRLREASRTARPVARVVDLDGGAESLVEPSGEVSGAELPPAVIDAALGAMETDRSARLPDSAYFVRPYNPPIRLIIVGATHIAQFLAPIAETAGYGVTLVDPRRAFASPERFPGVEISTDWPDEAFDKLSPDSRTAVVALALDPKVDDVALMRALDSGAFYIGALGSHKNQALRLKRLAEAGYDEAALARIHGPVGLAIGALSPAEIAISILAELTRARRLGPSA